MGSRRETRAGDRLDEFIAQASSDPATQAWARNFQQHARGIRRFRRVMRSLPADPRCKFCYAPFAGAGGRVMSATGRRPSRKNPNLCNVCVEDGPAMGFESETGVLFGDVRGFTAYAETRPSSEVAAAMERFYAIATKVVVGHEGIVDKMVGDEVMALFWPALMEGDACAEMVSAAQDLLRGLGHGGDEGGRLPLGVGLDYGRAYVGNIGTTELRDFTALGDVVNTAARLQAQASAGEIVMSEHVYDAVRAQHPGAVERRLELKGKAAPITAYVLAVGS